VIRPTRKPNGRYAIRWREGGTRHQLTFDLRKDAEAAALEVSRRLQSHGLVDLNRGSVTLGEFVETWWTLHVIPNLAPDTRDVYLHVWGKHLHPRLASRQLRQITPGVITRVRSDLERAGVGAPMVRKALSVLQSILAFAVVEGELQFNPAASVRKPRAQRTREPVIFSPVDVEQIRARLARPRDRALVSMLAYAGPRPEEALRTTFRDVGPEAIRFVDTKRHRERHTPLLRALAQDLREYQLTEGRPAPTRAVFAAHDGGHWQRDDWRNWVRRTWRPVAPAGSRPRDLRSSYVTLRVYEGVPLTTIAREVGTSVQMIDRHYAGTIANWDGQRVPADAQIRAARERLGRGVDALADSAGGPGA
jgi:integrase